MEENENDIEQTGDQGPEETYANNVNFQGTLWDLTMYFGDFGFRPYGSPEQKPSVIWHTAVTMPWIQAKLACFFLAVNLRVHEMENGPINIPKQALPVLPEDDSPAANAVRELFAQFFGQPPSSESPDTKK